jgi:hypothetical protein
MMGEMLALIDWPEAIVIVTLLIIAAMLAGYLLRGRKTWNRIKVGFFLERNGDDDERAGGG